VIQGARLGDAVSEPLVITLAVVVLHVLSEGVAKRPHSEENHSTQTFLFDGAHKSFRKSVQIRRSGRKSDHVHALASERTAKSIRVLRIPIQDQISFSPKDGVQVRDVAGNLHHPRILRMRSHAGDVHTTGGKVNEE
jgi:hypothetical protein